jgi:hypothetical protein
MKKLIAILGLLMLFLIQFGSVGFTVYKNECNKAKISTYTSTSVGCCCSKSDAKAETKAKSCCKSKSEKECSKPEKKSCCSKKKETETVNKKCCTSDLLLFKVMCESFNFESDRLNLDNTLDYIISARPVFKAKNTNFKSQLAKGNYNCNSPPLITIDKRILFQSFQI